jgi:hypothetical protein
MSNYFKKPIIRHRATLFLVGLDEKIALLNSGLRKLDMLRMMPRLGLRFAPEAHNLCLKFKNNDQHFFFVAAGSYWCQFAGARPGALT